MRHPTARAFTLVELMVTMTIIVLAATMVVPMIGALTGGNRVEGALLEIQGYLAMARQQAVQHNKVVAVRFVPPTKLTPQWRIMIEELKEAATDPSKPNSWRIMAGAYGVKLAPLLNVTNGDGKTDTGWRIWFDADGIISSKCPDNNVFITVGPGNKESAEPTISYAVNRASGQFLRFAPRIEYNE